ncbi:alpha-N-acetylglucosaminidase isoform X1 [Schistocerca piceifrons]|uniref:alpha-N-acetylglucosaminidase isoform X1 n=1 Tax=Schistocerca piceifrons TaxID=274613 RepID=UPI001F5FCEA8|nr:alpha-N-acetylglucosaminidase isoform X1 [Schistocerca piceifrons]
MNISNFVMMLIYCLILYLILPCRADNFQATLGHLVPRANAEIQSNGAFGVIQRLIPEKAHLFNVTVDPSIGPVARDTFKVIKESDSEIVRIIGTSGVAAAWGFHHYLKYYCGCHVSWEATQLNLPQALPEVNITITSRDRFRYYQNVCTTSYSFVWWDWARWEKEIDWMAMNSINLALAFNGQEAIWMQVYKRLNMTADEIDEHFTGPAFFAWNRMGNIRGWAGPLSDTWHNQQAVLQRRILDRMRELGIIPVLPAFAGHVPRAFERLFPDVNMTMMKKWNNFPEEYCCPYLLDPTDTLYQTVGRMFISELIAQYGTDHIYNCDTFNEMEPNSGDLDYLSAVSAATFEALTSVDPKAVWMLQNWAFVHEQSFWTVERVRAYISSVPKGRMIVLDLQSELSPHYEELDSYFGQPFIWCMLHNFGGTLGLYGAIENVNRGVFQGRSMANSTMVGTGLTPEGINQNYVMYDFMNEMSWREEPADLKEWFSQYATRRYGAYNENADEAWQLLKSSVYSFRGSQRVRGKYIICRRPSLKLKSLVWYNISEVVLAWDKLLLASEEFNNSSCYKHDVVDVTRQYLQVLGSGLYRRFRNGYFTGDVQAFQKNAEDFLSLLGDLDTLLGSSEAFLLGAWLKSAKALATTPLEESLYEYNARNQITLWGPDGEITDYATKQWSGIVSHYYAPRWQFFIEAINDTLLNNVTFNITTFREDLFSQVEEPFTLDTSEFPDTPQGDSIALARQIHARWRNRAQVLRKLQNRKKSNHDLEKESKEPEKYLKWFSNIWTGFWRELFQSLTSMLRFRETDKWQIEE